MTRKALTITLSLVCIATSSGIGRAIADDSKSPSPRDELSKFVGEGACTGTVMAMGKSPEHAKTGKYHGEKTLDGQWIVIHYDEDKTDVNPKPLHVQQYFGYDPAKKMFVSVEFDNMDPMYTPATTSRWKGDTLTFEYTASVDGKLVSLRDFFTVNASGISHTGMMRDKTGEWVKTGNETCKVS